MGWNGIAAAFGKNEHGVEVVEYAVIVALIVGGTIVAVGSLLAALINQGQNLIQIISGI
jgi:Flp pilus assembly pilin Flp